MYKVFTILLEEAVSYLIFLKPFLYFTGYTGIQRLNLFCEIFLVAFLSYILLKKGVGELIIPYLLSYGMTMPLINALTIEFSMGFYVHIIAMLAIVGTSHEQHLPRNIWIGKTLYLLFGISICYFDFLVYSFVSLGMPLALDLYLDEDFELKAGIKKIFRNIFQWWLGYSEHLELHSNIKEILAMIQTDKFMMQKDITIQIRYIHEILTNRAGFAPNKSHGNINNKICILPFTDLSIFPNGEVGLCCNDVLEKTYLGNVNNNLIKEVWLSDTYQEVRRSIALGRNNYYFCKNCDFIDAGIRNSLIREMLRESKKGSIR